jgi:hypothetical protein
LVDPTGKEARMWDGAVAVDHGKANLTLPAAVIKYCEAHESELQG